MDIVVCTRSKQKAQFIQQCAEYFSRELKLQNSKYSLIIYTTANLRKNEKSYGKTGLLWEGDRLICMTLESRLPQHQLIETIAHEMVHVKQFAKGQLKHVQARNGRIVDMWLGKRVRATYWNSPWEREAYRREKELTHKLAGLIQRKNNRNIA